MSFQASKNLGEVGALIYFQAHEGKLEQLDGFKSDFRELATGKGIELKTDFWAMTKTPNYFFERHSNLERGTDGGPWQALGHGSDKFVYFYVRDLTFYEFETRALVDALEKIIPELPPTDVPNPKYTTRGYRVPRKMLEGLTEPKKIVVRLEDDGET